VTRWWVVTAINANGETTVSNQFAQYTDPLANKTLTWNAVPGATGYKVYRGLSSGAYTTLAATLGAVTTYVDSGAAGTAASPPTTNTTLGPPAGWVLSIAVAGRDTTLKLAPKAYSLSLSNAGASAVSKATYTFPAGTWEHLRGQVVTVAAKIYRPSGSTSVQGRVGILDGSTSYAWDVSTSLDQIGAWMWQAITFRVAPAAGSLSVSLNVTLSAETGGAMRVDQVTLARGVLPAAAA
jgi:hypothetical protein